MSEQTVEGFYNTFKQQMESGDATAVSMGNMLGEHGAKLGRKLTKQEAVSLMWESMPQQYQSQMQFSDFPTAKIQETLQSLSGQPKPTQQPIAQAKPGDPPPSPVKSGQQATLMSSIDRGTSEGAAQLDRLGANVTGMLGKIPGKGGDRFKEMSKTMRDRQHKAEAYAQSIPAPSPDSLPQNIAAAVPRAVVGGAPAMLSRTPLGFAVVGAAEHADEGAVSAVGHGAMDYAFGKLMGPIGDWAEKWFGKVLPGTLGRVTGRAARPAAVAAVPVAADLVQGKPLNEALADGLTAAGVSEAHGRVSRGKNGGQPRKPKFKEKPAPNVSKATAPEVTETTPSLSAAEPDRIVQRPVERQNETQAARVKATREFRGMDETGEQGTEMSTTSALRAAESEIGELQDQLNGLQSGTPEHTKMEQQVAKLLVERRQLRTERRREIGDRIDKLTALLPGNDGVGVPPPDPTPKSFLRSEGYQPPTTETPRYGPPKMTPERAAIDSELARLKKELTTMVREDRGGVEQPRPGTTAPPEPVREPATAAKDRAEAAAERAKGQQQDIPGLGRRVAGEETGELPAREEPGDRPVGTEQGPPVPKGPTKPATGPDGKPIEPRNDFETDANPKAQQYTVQRMPGVPAGTTIIPRGLTPQGFVIDIVDPGGRMTQKTLPFRDSLKAMEQKGWIKAKPGKPDGTFRSQQPTPEPGISVPPEIVDERGPGSSERLPATIPPNAGPPEGGLQLLTPEQLAAAVNKSDPKLLGAGPQTTRSMKPLEEASAGTRQSPEVLANAARQMTPEARASYVQRIQQAFMDQVSHLDPAKATDEQKGQLAKAYQALQEYLKPFMAEAPKPAESNGGLAKAMPPGLEAQVKNLADTIAAKKGAVSEAWKNITIQPMAADLRTAIGKPVTMPIAEFNGQSVWNAVSAAQGAGGIKITDPDFGPGSGTVIRPLDLNGSAPPDPVRPQ